MTLPTPLMRDELDRSLDPVWKDIEALQAEVKALQVEVEGLRLIAEKQAGEIRALKKKGRGAKGREKSVKVKGGTSS
jgi:cell division septum initiation protein DivIVA